MKRLFSIYLYSFLIIILSNCATAQIKQPEKQYDFSFKNTLSIFLRNNEKGIFFCIPVQYLGDYQVQSFEYRSGLILIGGYEISLKRDDINISVYLNQTADESGSSDSGFNLVYSEENNQVLLSKMDEPLAVKESDDILNHYYIFIEKFIKDDDIEKIISEYEKGNIYSRFEIWYDLVIDNEEQFGNGMLDDFELYDGTAYDPEWFPPNLNFFKTKYMESTTPSEFSDRL